MFITNVILLISQFMLVGEEKLIINGAGRGTGQELKKKGWAGFGRGLCFLFGYTS